MRISYVLFTFLLAYVIAALIFWWLSLEKHSVKLAEKDRLLLCDRIDSVKYPLEFQTQLKKIKVDQHRRSMQYTGEGVTFLVFIFAGAFIVLMSFRRWLRLNRQQNNFMMAVTHELKSPIAGIKLSLQTLQRHKLDQEKTKQIIDRSVAESDRLNELCSNLLLTSQMEGRQYKAQKVSVNMSELLLHLQQSYQQRKPNRISCECEPDLFIIGDATLIELALSNLMDNALKYSGNEDKVHISLSSANHQAIIKIIDQGVGIPDHEKKMVFKKFYRMGNEYTRSTKGTGLGLYLTKKIVLQHKGQIKIEDNLPKGSIFQIHLPLA